MNIDAVVAAVTKRLPDSRTGIVGISGAVASGKTTIADAVAEAIRSTGRTIRVVSTDAFLLTNALLNERDLVMRKGFPETYNLDAIVTVLGALRSRRSVDIPVYSHGSYDIVEGRTERIDPCDVLVLEGVVALQRPVAGALDVAVYIDADERDVRGWFVQRFMRLTDEGRDDSSSFYHLFATMDDDAVRAIAEATWDGINGVNLHDHIGPSMSNADVTVRKGSDHEILEVRAVR